MQPWIWAIIWRVAPWWAAAVLSTWAVIGYRYATVSTFRESKDGWGCRRVVEEGAGLWAMVAVLLSVAFWPAFLLSSIGAIVQRRRDDKAEELEASEKKTAALLGVVDRDMEKQKQ